VEREPQAIPGSRFASVVRTSFVAAMLIPPDEMGSVAEWIIGLCIAIRISVENWGVPAISGIAFTGKLVSLSR
jgi:hypothetical protein